MSAYLTGPARDVLRFMNLCEAGVGQCDLQTFGELLGKRVSAVIRDEIDMRLLHLRVVAEHVEQERKAWAEVHGLVDLFDRSRFPLPSPDPRGGAR